MANLTPSTSALGRSLRTLREARGWSRDTLASRAGVGEATIARVELYGHEPSLPVLRSLAVGLGVPLAHLLDELEPKDAA